MKPASSVELPDGQPATAAADAKPVTQYVTVYTFYVYDHDQGKTVIYPRMATAAAIAGATFQAAINNGVSELYEQSRRPAEIVGAITAGTSGATASSGETVQ